MTILINLYGGPGSGKTTGATYIFSQLKQQGLKASYVPEFVTGLIESGFPLTPEHGANNAFQIWTFSNQLKLIMDQVYLGCDYIVTDSPMFQNLYYCQDNSLKEKLIKLLSEVPRYLSLDSRHYLIQRAKPFSTFKRVHDEAFSDEMTLTLSKQIDCIKVKGNIDGYNFILKSILNSETLQHG